MERAFRKPPCTGAIQLTARDKRWIWAAFRFGVITTDQAMTIAGATSREAVNARLALLWAHDYLARPVAAMRRLYSHAPKRHVLHMLGQAGAAYLRDVEGVSLASKKGWTAVAEGLRGQNVEHDIGVVDFVLALQEGVSEREGLKITHQFELLVQHGRALEQKPGRLPTKVYRQRQLINRATDPDYTFELHKEQADGTERTGLCFLEYDNRTEDFIKADTLASSIRQKHECYADAYKRKLHTELYARNNFRVLFVVNDTWARVEKMQAVYQGSVADKIAPGVFLYTTFETIRADGVFGGQWQNGAGESVVL